MKTYLLSLWDSARSSYWFLPAHLATAAVILAIVLPRIDFWLDDQVDLPEWILTTTDAARATLTATGGAMVAVTGTVFSITIVTLSLASQQFGPRLLRRFMYDLTTQLTLGVFLSTGFYCLLVLRVIEAGPHAQVPHLAVAASVVLAVISMGMLITFIHHTAILIQAPHVVAGVAEDLDDAVQRLYPEQMGQSADANEVRQGMDQLHKQTIEDSRRQKKFQIKSRHEGYVQAIDSGSWLTAAKQSNVVLDLDFAPGHFITRDAVLAVGWHADPSADEDFDCDKLAAVLNEAIVVGKRRTPRQDVECAIFELVEVAVRALSPGINDPFTAINCIDRLSATLGRLTERDIPAPYRCDEEGTLRIITPRDDFATAINAAFNQIRQYGRDSAAVTIRLLDACQLIASRASRPADLHAVRHHADMIHRSGQEALPEESDRRDVGERYQKILTTIAVRERAVKTPQEAPAEQADA